MRWVRILSITLVTVLAAALAPTAPAFGSHDVTPARVAGEDRFETAAEVARLQFPGGASTAVIATGKEFPDALSGTGLAGAADAPILLVRHAQVPEPTTEALEDLGVGNVYILGGDDAISRDVEAELEERYEVARVGGSNRYGTAELVAREIDRLEGQLGEIAGLTTAFVASGQTFPDALAAGSVATTGEHPFPILLVGTDAYPRATERAIEDLGIDQAIIVGGHEAVSDHVERHLEEDTRAVRRLAGTDRHATAVAVADFAMIEFDYHGELTVLARSDVFADALTVGLHAGRNDAAILLAPPGQLPRPTHQWLHDLCPTVEVVRAAGGHVAVSPSTLDDAQRHAEHCHASEDQTGETYVVEPTRSVEASPGDSVDLTVRDRYDERPLQEPLDITLFPCGSVDRAAGTFIDADGDGYADDIAESETDAAHITDATEADRVEPRYAHNGRFLHGAMSWTVHSDDADCTVTVVFDDIDDDDRLPVDDEGHPLEHHGMRQVTWSTSE